jgi:putative aminopeptidase FrvX
MTDNDYQLLEELIATPSPSGHEQALQKIVRRELAPIAQSVQTDMLGNLVATLSSSAEKPTRVMLTAHCDEIGFLIKYIDENGFIFFAPVGGVDPHLVPGQRVHIHTANGPLLGVVGKKPIHLLETKDRERVIPFTEQFVDIGCSSREEAKALVAVGDPMTIRVGLERLQGDRVVGRGFDDRMGVFAMLRTVQLAARQSLPCQLSAVSVVQEELGLRGAQPACFGLAPDVALVIEIGHASDTPTNDPKIVGEVKLGSGPVLSRGPNVNPALFALLQRTAAEEQIPIQVIGEQRATSTDANVIQLSRQGVATALVRVPTRYVHTSSEVLSLADLDAAVRLLTATVCKIKERDSFIPR